MKYNLGHKFETLMAKSLESNGISILDKKNATYLSFNYKEDSGLKIMLGTFIKKFIKVSEFSIPTHKQNKKSLSSDFYNKNQSISCKKDNLALKHPKLGAIFSILYGFNLLQTFFFNDKEKLTRKEFYKKYKLSRKDFFNFYSQSLFIKLKDSKPHYKKIQKTYNFILGKDKPIIVKFDSFKNQLWVLDTSKISMPTHCDIDIETNSKGRIGLVLKFNNGITVKQRIKSATNAKASTNWFNLFKEEWTLVNTPIVEKSKIIIKN
jgi:hypothetical protein